MAFRDQVTYLSELVVDLFKSGSDTQPRIEIHTFQDFGVNRISFFNPTYTNPNTEQLESFIEADSQDDTGSGASHTFNLMGTVMAGAVQTLRANLQLAVYKNYGIGHLTGSYAQLTADNISAFTHDHGNPKVNMQIPLEDTGWIEVANGRGLIGGVGFQNGWVDYSAPTYPSAAYRRINGIVYLRGLIKNGVVGSTMFNLPAGFRPGTGTNLFSGIDGANTTSRTDIEGATGRVFHQAGNTGFISLNGIRFPAEQ